MSILDTFYLLFKADTSDLEKGSEKAIKKTKELNKNLQDTESVSQKVGQRFSEILKPLISIAAGFASVNAVISGFKNTLDYDIDLGKASRALGVNIEQLDAWDNAVRLAGGTADGFQSSLRSLAEHFNTNPSVAIKFLPQLADVFSKISRFSAFKLGKSLGITDEATILLLQQGRREVEDLIKQQYELGVVTKKDEELTTIYNRSLLKLDISYRKLSNTLFEDILPIFTSFFDLLGKGFRYLTDHKDLVIGAFIGIGAAALTAGIRFGLITLEVLLISAAVIALIAIFALLFEDIRGYFKGSDSLLGEYIEEWKRLGKIINNIIDEWIDKISAFLNKFSAFRAIVDYFKNHESSFDKFQESDTGKNLLNFASQSPINNQANNSVFNSSLFNKDNNIHIGEINMEIQSNDAQGVAIGLRSELHKYLFSEYNQAQANSSDNVGY